MVSDRLMKVFLEKLKPEPQTMRELCTKLGRQEGNVRVVLLAMKELGLVEKVEIKRAGFGKRPVSVGWRIPSVSNSLPKITLPKKD